MEFVMKDICDEYDVKLFVRSAPLVDNEENHSWKKYKQDIIDYGLEEILGEFIENIKYYPEDWFADGIHFKSDIIEEYGDSIKATLLD